ncbi:hypothetical protein PR048_019671 [Dryococelus australis]|uniref:TAZ-type domain-containing protein n=1 Tax=Dryococelus australis TaxID=614101 RepID=A0ABQ9H452_9NEOP|nr:hypothetical protein PR048_019671 [Dryococelus australis]
MRMVYIDDTMNVKICDLQAEYECPSLRKLKAHCANINHTYRMCKHHWSCSCLNVLLLRKWTIECEDNRFCVWVLGEQNTAIPFA